MTPTPTRQWLNHRSFIGRTGGNKYPYRTSAHWTGDILRKDEGTITRAEYYRRMNGEGE